MKILAADDNPIELSVVKNLLERWGYEVLTASDGLRALSLLRAPEPPRLAILDWMMPGINGIEVCRQLRSNPSCRAPYLILLTGRSQAKDLTAALDAGADDYIAKPFQVEELRARTQVGCRLLALQDNYLKHERLTGVLHTAAAVCHELNQPLQALVTAAQLLSAEITQNGCQRELVLTIHDSASRLGAITRRLMNITHAESQAYLGRPGQILDLHRSARCESDRVAGPNPAHP